MFQPLHSLVTILLDPKPTKTDGGLFIPDMAEATYRVGTVQAVGPAAYTDCSNGECVSIHPGDRVMVGAQQDQSGHIVNFGSVDVDGRDVALVNFSDIWGVIETAPLN